MLEPRIYKVVVLYQKRNAPRVGVGATESRRQHRAIAEVQD
jgi:hypothetical protein